MVSEVRIPAVGESISSGVISSWQKQEGDPVHEGEVLFTFETDKVSTEITAPRTGTLRVKAAEGAEVRVGEVVALIEGEVAPGSAAPAPPPRKPEEAPHAQPLSSPQPVLPVAIPEAAREVPALPEAGERTSGVSPRVTRKPLSPLRRKIAAQLVAAQRTAAMLTTFNECDLTALQQMRRRMQEPFQKRHGVKLGLMSFFLKATVSALKAVPRINARLEGEDLIENHYFDLGVAVGSERGLLVPVIREVDQKSFAQLEQEILEVSQRAREGKVKLEELQGGVFTITNGGVYGSLLSTPILNAPQSGILGLHKIQDRPVVVEGQVVIRPMMYLALSYDHRVVDGKEAVTFLIKIKEAIEDPLRLMLEV